MSQKFYLISRLFLELETWNFGLIQSIIWHLIIKKWFDHYHLLDISNNKIQSFQRKSKDAFDKEMKKLSFDNFIDDIICVEWHNNNISLKSNILLFRKDFKRSKMLKSKYITVNWNTFPLNYFLPNIFFKIDDDKSEWFSKI